MTQHLVEKEQGGYKVDGLDLRAANCGCGGLTGPGGAGTGECCFTFSRVKKDGNTILYFGKKTTPNTTSNFEWGYKVRKEGFEVEVRVLDTKGPVSFKFGGIEPPQLSAWKSRKWEVISSYERPLEGTGEPLPEWCSSAESACIRPEVELESPKGDIKRT